MKNKNEIKPVFPNNHVEFDARKGTLFEKRKPSRYMTDDDISKLSLLKQLNWLSATIIFLPLIAFFVGSRLVVFQWRTFLLALSQYILTLGSISAGYHRLYSHRSYRASAPIEYFVLAWGAAAFQGSARWWARNHRAHHRYVDTDKDPYTVRRGFWHAHIGWMLFKQQASRVGRVDISDLNANPRVMWQHRHYIPLALFFSFALPLAIATILWKDFWGALIYACFGRIALAQQATFCVNSLAHTIGEQPYSLENTSHDHLITALLTMGEGYHNFHHEFPHDYRNGPLWFHYDPSKWALYLLARFGLCWDLVRFGDNELLRCRYKVEARDLELRRQQLDRLRDSLDWGVKVELLGVMDWEAVRERVATGELLVVIDGLVHILDSEFVDRHPGGRAILEFWNGRDASAALSGEVYRHSSNARNMMAPFRVARLKEAAAILIMVRACFGWRPSTATKALGSMFEERYPGIFLLGTEDDRCLTLKNMYPRMPQKLIDETVMIGTIRRLIKCNTLDQFFQRKLYGHEERAIWRVECELVASVLGKRMKIGQKKMYSFSELESRVKHEAGLYFEL